MAKKKAAARRGTPKRAARSKARTVKPPARRARGPRQQPLIPETRIKPIDEAADALNDNLNAIATETTQAKTNKSTLLRLMKENRVTNVARGGRRFSRVPGDEKLMVSKASGDTNQDQDEPEPLEDEGSELEALEDGGDDDVPVFDEEEP